jgi:hypothetical protein
MLTLNKQQAANSEQQATSSKQQAPTPTRQDGSLVLDGCVFLLNRVIRRTECTNPSNSNGDGVQNHH